MPRPCKNRRIRGRPNSDYFKPARVPLNSLEEIKLTMDEFESLRLVHVKELSQGDASKKMEISQPTLSRVLNSAMKKVSDALVNGKAIKIK
jgi:predicted DNA-binding protein (UPF0251 family)